MPISKKSSSVSFASVFLFERCLAKSDCLCGAVAEWCLKIWLTNTAGFRWFSTMACGSASGCSDTMVLTGDKQFARPSEPIKGEKPEYHTAWYSGFWKGKEKMKLKKEKNVGTSCLTMRPTMSSARPAVSLLRRIYRIIPISSCRWFGGVGSIKRFLRWKKVISFSCF